MPLSNAIGPRTARMLERMEKELQGVKAEWRTTADRLAAATASVELSDVDAASLMKNHAMMVGLLRGCQELLHATRAIILNRQLVMVTEGKEADL